MIRSRVSSMPTLCFYRVMGVVDASMVFPIRRASHCTAIKTDTKHIDIRAADIYLCVQWIVAGGTQTRLSVSYYKSNGGCSNKSNKAGAFVFFFFCIALYRNTKKNHIVQTIYICTDTNMGCYRNFFQRCRRPFKGLTINHIHIHAVASGTFPWESLSSDN